MADVLEDFEWTPDCQGKQDFDGEIVALSTRYWPRGGGFTILCNGRMEENDARPEIRPSAVAAIRVLGEDVAEQRFEADTEAEVKAAVEAWARAKIAAVVASVRAALDLLDGEGA